MLLYIYIQISSNKEITGKGQIEKYINEVDSSLCIDMKKFEVKFNKEDIPNFYYNDKDYIDNKDIDCLPKLNTRHYLDEGDNESDSSGDNESVSSGDNESVSSGDNNKEEDNNSTIVNDTNMAKCVYCKKEIPKEKSLKSIAINNSTNNPEEIYFCCFDCFEKYDKWPSLNKKPKKDKKDKKDKN